MDSVLLITVKPFDSKGPRDLYIITRFESLVTTGSGEGEFALTWAEQDICLLWVSDYFTVRLSALHHSSVSPQTTIYHMQMVIPAATPHICKHRTSCTPVYQIRRANHHRISHMQCLTTLCCTAKEVGFVDRLSIGLCLIFKTNLSI